MLNHQQWQVSEKQTRNLIELKEEALIDRAMLQKREQELMRQRQEERRKINEKLDQKKTLQEQMLEKKVKCEEAREQFYLEKGQVDDIVNQIINEDRVYHFIQILIKNFFIYITFFRVVSSL